MTTTSYIQPPPDSTGKKIELQLVQNADAIDTFRQKMADGQKVVLDGEYAAQILDELGVISWLLARIQQSLSADAHPVDLKDLRQELKIINIRS